MKPLLFIFLFVVVIFGFGVTSASAYTFTCGSPGTDPTATTCEVLRERMEENTIATSTLDSDLKWVVYSIGFVAGLLSTGYGLHSLRRSVFGKMVTE